MHRVVFFGMLEIIRNLIKVGIDISFYVSDIRHSHLVLRYLRKYFALNPLIPKWKSPDIDIRFHSNIKLFRYLICKNYFQMTLIKIRSYTLELCHILVSHNPIMQ